MVHRVVIVGAGPGGLAAAILLAQAGVQVQILERLPRVGGRTSTIAAHGFRFDLGPTFLLYPRILAEIYATAGYDLSQEIDLIRLDPQYWLVFGVGGEINATPNVGRMEQEIARLTPADATALRRFLADNRTKLARFRPCLESPFLGWRDILTPHMLRLLPLLRPWCSLDRDLRTYFTDPRVRLVFAFQATYLGMSPFQCPSLFSILAFLEYEYGVFHPIGGCGAVTENMAQVAAALGVDLEVRREPLGVVLIIAAAHYPLFLPGVQTLQALAAGNAVLLKPGEGGGTAARALARSLEAAGLERHLVHVLSESPAAAQAAIHAGVDKVLLTGSAATGAAVLAALAPRLIPAVLELSGCDAAFVRADADLDLVVQALAFSWRLNSGATCIAPRRVFVARALVATLEARLTRMAQAMAPCVVAQPAVTLVQELVNEACQQGARRLTGDFLPDHTLTPVVVADATPAMRLLHADVFAPVLALVPVNDDEEALMAAAHCPYALGATVFGQETGARALAYRAQAGVVVVNDVIVPTAAPRLPFGGHGRSGFGVTRAAEGLQALTALKAVSVRRGRWRPDGAASSMSVLSSRRWQHPRYWSLWMLMCAWHRMGWRVWRRFCSAVGPTW